jgi:hypothetical protein
MRSASYENVKSEWEKVLERKHAAEHQVLHCCKPVISEIY